MRITRKIFEESHKYCPNCGNDKFKSTLIGYIENSNKDFEDHNNIWCKCGFTGTSMDLISLEYKRNKKIGEIING